MKIFSKLYAKVIAWSKHRHAPYYLAISSFAESSFFPIPPDFMLAPMVLARRDKAFLYATITTIASVLGGLFGYLIGYFAFEVVHPLILKFGYEPTYQKIDQWFEQWDFWIIFLAGFTPIPYKIFTIAAGATQISLLPFILGSLIGRGGRFYLVALLIRWGGERVEPIIIKYIDRVTWILIVMGLIVGIWQWVR